MRKTIPKIIHYCWLSNDPIPSNLQSCMDSWRKYMPEFTIKRWSTENFDVSSIPIVKDSYNARKWAFAADYIRMYALYHEGGIYLDSDVMLYGSLEPLLDADFVSAIEYHPSFEENLKNIEDKTLNSFFERVCEGKKVWGIGVQAAVIASISNHPYIKKVLNFYEQYETLEALLKERLTAPTVMAYNMEEYGFKYFDNEQRLQGIIHLYPTNIIGNYDQKCKSSIAVHFCAGSWTKKTLRGRITKKLNQFVLYKKVRDSIKKIQLKFMGSS